MLANSERHPNSTRRRPGFCRLVVSAEGQKAIAEYKSRRAAILPDAGQPVCEERGDQADTGAS